MVKKFNLILMGILVLVGVSLACGSVQVGVVTPTAGEQPTQEGVIEVEEGQPDVAISTPTVEAGTVSTQADYAAMWIEYWDPKYGYGVALPAHWIVYPTPTEGYGGVMTAASYDEAYFLANSIISFFKTPPPPRALILSPSAAEPSAR